MNNELELEFTGAGSLDLEIQSSAGTSNYNALTNKPSIEGHTLQGDSTIQQIGVGELSAQEIDRIIFG